MQESEDGKISFEIPAPRLDEAAELLRLVYIPLSQAKLWDRNATALGGIVEGNGRTEALIRMRDQGQDVPRGVALDLNTGEWCMPMIFGVDATSRLAAERYGIDHNNLVMAGGDFTAVDMARNYSEGYLQIIQDLQKAELLPASVDNDDVKAIVADALERAKAAEEEPSDGSLLALSKVVIDDPRNLPEPGEVWHLGPHTLLVVDVMTEWHIWAPLLEGEGKIFVPYPGPFAPLTVKAQKYTMIMVQPDPYIAGHIIDRWEDVHGGQDLAKD